MTVDNEYTFYPIANDDFNRDTIEHFREDPELAEMCLRDEIKEYNKTGNMTYVLQTLETIIRAFGIKKYAEKNKIHRSTLNNVFRARHEPEINTMNTILKPLGYEAVLNFRKVC